jgi:hypothetical protein
MRKITGTTGQSPWTARVPPTALQKNITDPTDKSIPAVNKTKVIPTATTATDEDWTRMFIKFSTVRKLGEEMVKNTAITRKRRSGTAE